MLRLFALALVLAAPAAHAQLLPSVSLGVAGGPNFASLNDVRSGELGSSTGFHVGVYGDVSIPFVSLRTGVYYLRAGDVEVQGQAEPTSANFVTVPVDFRVQTPTPIVKAYALVGPEFRFPLGDGGPTLDTRSVNVAANVGIGASFKAPLAGPSGFLELRYSQDVSGFATLVSNNADDTYRVSLVQVRVGVGL